MDGTFIFLVLIEKMAEYILSFTSTVYISFTVLYRKQKLYNFIATVKNTLLNMFKIQKMINM